MLDLDINTWLLEPLTNKPRPSMGQTVGCDPDRDHGGEVGLVMGLGITVYTTFVQFCGILF